MCKTLTHDTYMKISVRGKGAGGCTGTKSYHGFNSSQYSLPEPFPSLRLCRTLSASFSPSLFSLPPPGLLLLYRGVLLWGSSEWSSSGCKLSSCALRLQSLQCSVQTAVNVYVCIILSQWQALNELLMLYKFLFLSHHKSYQQCESFPLTFLYAGFLLPSASLYSCISDCVSSHCLYTC